MTGDRLLVSRDSDPVHARIYSGSALPEDLQQRASRRLGWLALVLAISWLSLRLIILGFQIVDGTSRAVGSDLVIVVALILSACMFALTRMRALAPHQTLDVGLAYAAVTALLISLAENFLPWPDGYVLRGAPYVCWWIILWPVFIPTTQTKAIVVLLASALSAPIALKLSVTLLDNPEQPADLYLLLFLISMVAAIVGFIASRVIYQLSADIGRAREMGAYQLVRKIGTGGMGDVWAAEHKALARPAAVKIIKKEALGNTAAEAKTILARFEREARATAALRSPHTVVLYDYGTTETGTFYYVMELLHGFELEELVKRFGPMQPERVAHVIKQACHSLFESHQRNLVHRDIKPANIHLCRYGADFDFVKVLDFGLVKSEFEPKDARLTAEGMTSGTPAFMAPEMARGRTTVGAAADIYALGCVAYFLLTGQLVFEASNAITMLTKQIDARPIPVSERVDGTIPQALEDAVMSCLAKDPADRPASARHLAARLEEIAFDTPWTVERAEEWWRLNADDQGSIAIESPTIPEAKPLFAPPTDEAATTTRLKKADAPQGAD